MLVANRALSHCAAPGRAITTMSIAGRAALRCRKDSLTTRLIRLRCTADLDTLRETARPSLAVGPGPGTLITVNEASLRRRPALNTLPKSAADRSRCAAGKPLGCASASALPLSVVPADRASDGEPHATLCAAAGEHQSAVLGSHAGAETMGAFSPQIARLVSALHGADSVRRVLRASRRWARQKDWKSYAAPLGVSTAMICSGSGLSPVDNPGLAL